MILLNIPLNPITCTLLEFISGLSPSLMFAAILVKTRKVYHVFNAKIMEDNRVSVIGPSVSMCPEGIEEKLEKMMAPKTSQILTIIFLVFVQFTVILVWSLSNDDVYLVDIYPATRHLRICEYKITEFFGIQAFNVLLVILCTAYGYMTRNVRR